MQLLSEDDEKFSGNPRFAQAFYIFAASCLISYLAAIAGLQSILHLAFCVSAADA